MRQLALASFLPSHRAGWLQRAATPVAPGQPRVIPLHRPFWRRAAASLHRWWLAQHEQALARQRRRELSGLSAATLRDIGFGTCARPEALPDWSTYERARW